MMNVQADIQATASLLLRNGEHKLPMLATATIVMDGLIMTADYKKYLQRGLLSIDMQDYLVTANNWC
jgi:hypothetical protein